MLKVSQAGSVVTLTLDRPDVRNALDDALIAELHQAIHNLAVTTRVLVLTGSGEAFCSGADLEWMRRASEYTKEKNQADALKAANLFESVAQCPAIVIAVVNGACFGGGCGLVAASDVAIAVDSAKFAFSEVKLGLVPATISPFVIPKIGAGHARHLFSTGEIFGADHALRIGLVHDVVSQDDLEKAVNKRIKAILQAGPKAASAAKRLAQTGPLELDQAAELLAIVRSSEEAKEGISAFLEKRKASYVEDFK